MALLDVNVLVALAWSSHVHHTAARRWFGSRGPLGWATCPMTEAGFVRVSTNRHAVDARVAVADARDVLRQLLAAGQHRRLDNDVSQLDDDVPSVHRSRDVTDAVLLTLARRHGMTLVTFDRAIATLDASAGDVELLTF